MKGQEGDRDNHDDNNNSFGDIRAVVTPEPR